MPVEQHDFMDGKLHVYKRLNSQLWQCSTYLEGRNWRVSTKQENLARAQAFAEDWYLGLRGRSSIGELKAGRTFAQAAARFLPEYEVITQGERSPRYVKQHGDRLRVHLLPYFGKKRLTEITSGLVQDYRIHRAKTSKTGKPPARSTLHHEIVTLRLVLKTACRHGWLTALPDLSMPYRASGKVSHRPWFSPDEYKTLYTATRARAKAPLKKRWKSECEDLHDYVLFMANTGLRPDEATRLEHRDVKIVVDAQTGDRILEIEVRGKRGVGYCKSMPNAVLPYERIVGRNNPQPTDKVFQTNHRELFNSILEEISLKKDRDGRRRTAYSLRHSYISMRLLEGADIYQIAKNCRTSVEMIEKHYAAHIKDQIDASAVNVRRARPRLTSRKRSKR